MENNEIKSYESSLFLKYHKAKVSNLILVRDGRLSSCSLDGALIIYKKHSFQIDQIIEGKTSINFHLQLNNNDIIILYIIVRYSLLNIRMEIYELNNKKFKLSQEIKTELPIYKYMYVNKLLEIDDKTFGLCYKYRCLKIYKKDENNKYKKVFEKDIQPNSYNHLNILIINKSELASSVTGKRYIEFFDLKNKLEKIATINNIHCSERKNSMLMINDITLIVCGTQSNGIYLIDTKNHIAIKHIMQGFYFCCMIKLLNGNILVGFKDIYNGSGIVEYKYEKEELLEIKSVKEEKYIYNLCDMKNGKIASLPKYNKNIKIWEMFKVH